MPIAFGVEHLHAEDRRLRGDATHLRDRQDLAHGRARLVEMPGDGGDRRDLAVRAGHEVGGIELQAVISQRRAEIMHQIRDEVNTQAKGWGIDVIDVRVKRADLPEENSQAVYDRMKSERQREAAQYRAEGARQAQEIRADADRQRIEIIADAQKQSQILRGQGDSESIRISAEAYSQDKEFFTFYRSLQAYREGLSGQGTTLVLSPDSAFFKYLQSGPPTPSATPTPAVAPAR